MSRWGEMSEQIRVPKGLSGVSVTETKIAKSDVDGSLIYRGYTIEDLAENASFEETAYLVLYGELPKRTRFAADLRGEPPLHDLGKEAGEIGCMDLREGTHLLHGARPQRLLVHRQGRGLDSRRHLLGGYGRSGRPERPPARWSKRGSDADASRSRGPEYGGPLRR